MTPSLSLQFPIRHQVAKSYCRVVAAIDDEIFETGQQRQLTTLFSRLQESCMEHGVLCHLHHYPKLSGEPDDDVVVDNISAKEHHRRALQIAESADVIILDWNLGNDSATHAQSILKSLAKGEPVRFVLIYTSEDADVVRTRLEKEFEKERLKLQPLDEIPIPISDSEEEEEEDEDEDEEEKTIVEASEGVDPRATNRRNEIPKGFHLNNRLFIFIGTKTHLIAEELINQVREALTCCFSDHLRWAGLEMAVKTRELLPRIVAALPEDTDDALLLQLLYQRDNEVSEQVGDVLIDELRVALRDAKLETVCDTTLLEHLRAVMSDLGGEQQEKLFEKISLSLGSDYVAVRRQAIEKSKSQPLQPDEKQIVTFDSRWRDVQLKTLRKKVQTVDTDYWFPHLKGDKASGRQKNLDLCETIGCYLSGCMKGEDGVVASSIAWGMAKESVLLTPRHPIMQPGAVLRRLSDATKSGDAKDAEWVLCLTGACDCYRNKHGFLVVAGMERTGDIASGLRDTQSVFQKKEIVWDSSRLIVLLKDQIDLTSIVAADLPESAQNGDLAPPDSIENLATENVPTQSRYQVVGCLRQDAATRLIQRVWTYQTRVGVDGAEMLRQRRAE